METDFKNLKIGVAGLGLIGGSIAKALKNKAKVKEIIAWNHNQKAIDEGIAEGVISEDSGTDISCLKNCDVIYICTPVGLIVNTVITLGKLSPNSLITDTASTKGGIVKEIDAVSPPVRFIGGHPMAGSEKKGYAASTQSLYENAYYVICKGNGGSGEDLKLIEDLATAMGAIPVIMNPVLHDRAVALISHLPHLVAFALSRLAGEKDKGELLSLAAGGFKDLTRIASSNPSLWTDILKNNKDMVIYALNEYISQLENIKSTLQSENYKDVEEFLSSGKAFRDKLTDNASGLLNKYPEVWINVEDRPGVIGDVSTLLGKNGINIMNLNIHNIREYEGGVLRISLNSEENAERTKELLKSAGFEVN